VPASERLRYGIIGVGMQGAPLMTSAMTLTGVECVAAADLSLQTLDWETFLGDTPHGSAQPPSCGQGFHHGRRQSQGDPQDYCSNDRREHGWKRKNSPWPKSIAESSSGKLPKQPP
jgi:hypothetical protein